MIVGGGTAGWMTAAALAKVLGPRGPGITLVESDEIGTVGVGEATIPNISLFNALLGFSEDEFVRETRATFKLGIEFVDWRRIGHRYMHHFGLFGADMNGIAFSHYWLRALREGGDPDPTRFSAEAQAAYRGKFARTPQTSGAAPKIHYAFQFDAGLYAAFLRRFAEGLDVVRREGRVVAVEQQAETGFIESVRLEDGRTVAGDFFIDCSGFRGLLIEGALAAGYEDWTRWLPANRAWAVPCGRAADPVPYTRATARDAGWQWRIPLQHRTGNGYVFSDAFAGEDETLAALLGAIDGAPTAEPRLLKFTTGHRKRAWVKNCLAIGLSSNFMEPLESTSIHLVQAAIAKLLAMFPDRGFDPAPIERFNADFAALCESVRDFLVAHYKITERDDTPFWRHCRTMPIPDTLAAKLDLFRRRGEVMPANHELFREVNWFAVLNGQGLAPESYHPIADVIAPEDLRTRLGQIGSAISDLVVRLPSHGQFLQACCAR